MEWPCLSPQAVFKCVLGSFNIWRFCGKVINAVSGKSGLERHKEGCNQTFEGRQLPGVEPAAAFSKTASKPKITHRTVFRLTHLLLMSKQY